MNAMEDWELIVDTYGDIDRKCFLKAYQCAEKIMKEDLAPDEVDWFLDTLLRKPVNLLITVASKWNDNDWSDVIGKAFKLLSNVIMTYPDLASQHFENIVKLCEKTYDQRTRQQALQCLTCVVRHSDLGCGKYRRYVNSLETETTCKAPLAELVGAICEHHRDTVASHITTIWSVYLDLLDNKKFSGTIINSLLIGMEGVLTTFGPDLPTAKFPNFYNHLVKCKLKFKCIPVFLTLMEKHVHLFREQVANDADTRVWLWNLLGTTDTHELQTRNAIRAVYKAVQGYFTETFFQRIVSTEVMPRSESSSGRVRYTALRVLHDARLPAACTHHDAHELEHSLRHGNLGYDHAESILWSIECNVAVDNRLLKSALTFHTHIPTKYHKQIVVHGLLRSPADVRTEAVTFLTNATCQCVKDDGNMDKYMPLWKSFFDSSNDKDMIVIEKRGLVLVDFLEYLLYSLEYFLQNADGEAEELSDKLHCLLSISSHIIPLVESVNNDEHLHEIKELGKRVVRLLQELSDVCRGAVCVILGAARAVLVHVGSDSFYNFANIKIDECRDDAALHESCLAVALAPLAAVRDVGAVLVALQIIFSRKDLAPALTSRCINRLEELILNERKMIDEAALQKVVREVGKMHQRVKSMDRDARVLRRNALMFLGKYGGSSEAKDSSDEKVFHLKKYLTLGIPDISEGLTVKINLQGILQLALKYEDPKVLKVLLDLLCANSSGRVLSAAEEAALCRCACALMRARPHACAHAPLALDACGRAALRALVQCASCESSPAVRAAVCATLQRLAQQNKLTDALVQYATLNVCATSKSAGLDIAEMLLSILKDNNSLVQTLLPDLIVQISTARDMYSQVAFKNAADLLIDKVELFGGDVLKTVTLDLVKVLLLRPTQNGDTSHKMADVRVMRTMTKMTFDFLKELNRCKGNNVYEVVENIFEIVKRNGVEFSRLYYVLSVVREVFAFDAELCRNVLLEGDGCVCEKLFGEGRGESLDIMCLEGILKICTEYAEVLLELHHENTLKLLSKVFTKLQPNQVVQQNGNITSCLARYKSILKTIPQLLNASFTSWCSQLPLVTISGNLDNFCFPMEDVATVNSLRIMLDNFDIDNLELTLKEYTKQWLDCTKKYHSSGYLKQHVSQLDYFTDLVHVTFRFLTLTDIKAIMTTEGFCEVFMPVLFGYLIRRPYILMEPDMEGRCHLLNEVVKYCVRRCKVDQYCDSILDLVEELWPTYEKVSSFEQKHTLLRDLASLPRRLGPDSRPMRWLTQCIRSEESTNGMRAKLIGVLPPGEAYKSTWCWFAGLLPARLAEVQGEASLLLGALMEALLAADCSLLDSISQLVAGDTAEGWWDDAIEACMVSLAARRDMTVHNTIYKRCWDGLGLGVCNRLMVPLLRCSTSSICEEFFSTKLEELLTMLKRRARQVTAHYSYHKHVVNCVRVLTLLQVAFEKIPGRIESPKSVLYSQMSDSVGEDLFYLVKKVGAQCVDLAKGNTILCPDGADLKLKNNCFLLHCKNYNCLTAATWCRAPADPRFYEPIFNADAWLRIVDPDVEYALPLREYWELNRTMTQAVSVELDSSNKLLSRTATTKTRTFQHTLSENPLEFDVGVPEEEQESCQEMSLSDDEINHHPCAATLTASLSRASQLPHTQWLAATTAALTGQLHHNVKFLLAKAICNCREDLKRYAGSLRPALFAVTVDTSERERVLNGLHVDVLETIVYWRDDASDLPTDAVDNLNVTIERLITTCIRNGQRKKLVQHLIQKLSALLEMYSTVIQIGWSCLKECVEVRSVELTKIYLEILKTITKRKIHVPKLLINILKSLESKQDMSAGSSSGEDLAYRNLAKQVDLAYLAQLFGSAVSAAPQHVRYEFLKRYRRTMSSYKGNVQDYIKLLYDAQIGFPDICDEEIFRKISDLMPNTVGRTKTKCLDILSLYTSRASASEDVAALLESREICELVVQGDASALGLVENGLMLMSEELRRSFVVQCVEHCGHAVGKVRKAAYGVIIKAFENLLARDAEEPNPKRPAKLNSPLLRNEDFKTPFATLGLALASAEHGDLRDAVSRCLTSADVKKRFCESFIITLHLPATCVTATRQDMTASVTALLDLFFKDLRANEAFKRTLIRDNLESNTDRTPKTTPSKTGTQGNRLQQGQVSEPMAEEVKSVDDVLEALLEFSKSTPEAASALCLQVMAALSLRSGSGFDFAATMSELLVPMLGRISDVTPLVVEACRLFIDECCEINGFKEAAEDLLKSVKGTDGEDMVHVLYEDAVIRCSGYSYFALGKMNKENEDCELRDLSRGFDIEDMAASFGLLSNWDDLTLQQKKSEQSRLPPLWVDIDNFRMDLERWKDKPSDGWFDRMASVYHKEAHKSMRWLSELSRWPRNSFSISATVDAIELKKMQDEECSPSFTCDIQPTDCLAEWAARILIRSACIEAMHGETDTDVERTPSLSHALQWCMSANEKALSSQVLDCIGSMDNWKGYYERVGTITCTAQLMSSGNKQKVSQWFTSSRRTSSGNKKDVTSLPWLRQELIAARRVALDTADDQHPLIDVLERAESLDPSLLHGAPLEDVIGMDHLILVLRKDLNSLSKEILQNKLAVQRHLTLAGANKQVLKSMIQLAITYYDSLWEGQLESEEQNTLLTDMADVLGLALSLNLNFKYETLVDVILNRLDNFTGTLLTDDATAAVLGKMENLIHVLDDFAMEELTRNKGKFSSVSSGDLIAKLEREEQVTAKLKKCLQLVADPSYALRQYCKGLCGALMNNDAVAWSQIFNRLKDKIFENPYAGLDYQVLSKYQATLYSIAEFNLEKKKSTGKILLGLIKELTSQPEKLGLSQLCPTLTQASSLCGSETEECLSRLLMLPQGVHLERFEEQVSVFTDSVRRPVVLTARLSDGTGRKLLVKGGERLKVDAAAMRFVRALQLPGAAHYQVTPLGDDSGLIEYLEDHERIRSLIPSKYDVGTVSRAADDELILHARDDSISQFEQACSKIPSYVLRSVVEQGSSCIEDFISKKRRFEESLGVMTYASWLLGLNDRHLDNIMYCKRDGSVRCVDWNSVLRHGRVELPPARLTRCLLAVCRAPVLESSLQKWAAASRDCRQLLLPVLDVSFKWMGPEVHEELRDVRELLCGAALPHQVTVRSRLRLPGRYRHKYAAMLRDTFADFADGEQQYSVEEQITNLLRHCTDPHILSITRSSWQPWI